MLELFINRYMANRTSGKTNSGGNYNIPSSAKYHPGFTLPSVRQKQQAERAQAVQAVQQAQKVYAQQQARARYDPSYKAPPAPSPFPEKHIEKARQEQAAQEKAARTVAELELAKKTRLPSSAKFYRGFEKQLGEQDPQIRYSQAFERKIEAEQVKEAMKLTSPVSGEVTTTFRGQEQQVKYTIEPPVSTEPKTGLTAEGKPYEIPYTATYFPGFEDKLGKKTPPDVTLPPGAVFFPGFEKQIGTGNTAFFAERKAAQQYLSLEMAKHLGTKTELPEGVEYVPGFERQLGDMPGVIKPSKEFLKKVELEQQELRYKLPRDIKGKIQFEFGGQEVAAEYKLPAEQRPIPEVSFTEQVKERVPYGENIINVTKKIIPGVKGLTASSEGLKVLSESITKQIVPGVKGLTASSEGLKVLDKKIFKGIKEAPIHFRDLANQLPGMIGMKTTYKRFKEDPFVKSWYQEVVKRGVGRVKYKLGEGVKAFGAPVTKFKDLTLAPAEKVGIQTKPMPLEAPAFPTFGETFQLTGLGRKYSVLEMIKPHTTGELRKAVTLSQDIYKGTAFAGHQIVKGGYEYTVKHPVQIIGLFAGGYAVGAVIPTVSKLKYAPTVLKVAGKASKITMGGLLAYETGATALVKGYPAAFTKLGKRAVQAGAFIGGAAVGVRYPPSKIYATYREYQFNKATERWLSDMTGKEWRIERGYRTPAFTQDTKQVEVDYRGVGRHLKTYKTERYTRGLTTIGREGEVLRGVQTQLAPKDYDVLGKYKQPALGLKPPPQKTTLEQWIKSRKIKFVTLDSAVPGKKTILIQERDTFAEISRLARQAKLPTPPSEYQFKITGYTQQYEPTGFLEFKPVDKPMWDFSGLKPAPTSKLKLKIFKMKVARAAKVKGVRLQATITETGLLDKARGYIWDEPGAGLIVPPKGGGRVAPPGGRVITDIRVTPGYIFQPDIRFGDRDVSRIKIPPEMDFTRKGKVKPGRDERGKPRVDIFVTPLEKIKQKQRQRQVPMVSLVSAVGVSAKVKQKIDMDFKIKTPKTRIGIDIIPEPDKPTPPKIPVIKFPKLRKPKTKRGKAKKPKRRYKYQPSLVALGEKIYRRPQKTITGLGVRPIKVRM